MCKQVYILFMVLMITAKAISQSTADAYAAVNIISAAGVINEGGKSSINIKIALPKSILFTNYSTKKNDVQFFKTYEASIASVSILGDEQTYSVTLDPAAILHNANGGMIKVKSLTTSLIANQKKGTSTFINAAFEVNAFQQPGKYAPAVPLLATINFN